MPWDERPDTDLLDAMALDRLGLAAPLLGATGWIDDLARLVAVDTAAPPGQGYGAFAALLQDMFAPLGFGLRSLVVPEGAVPGAPSSGPRVNLVASRRSGRPTCTLHFQMDTPPAGPGWTRPPLTLTRQGHLLYGLGTRRMKGAIAAVWAALRAADAVGLGLRFDPVLVFTTDGGQGANPHAGLRHLAEQGALEGHLVSLGGLAAPRLWTGSPACLDLEIRIPAAAGAAEAALPVLSRLTALQGRLGQASDGPRLSITAVSAEQASTDAAAFCSLALHRRLGIGETADGIRAELDAVLEAALHPGHAATIREVSSIPAVVAPHLGPNAGRWQQAMRWGFGFGPEAFREYAAAEPSALGFVQQAGLTEILQAGLQRPGQPAQGPDECTSIDDVEALARSLLAYLADVPEFPSL
ncbi:M20/M25/M40 family metallo-hydrolase [Roseomonas sp. 18066]|uniref:M20/M25/M40 family metallo-hydrolase n=1 Tax=Roseomonas sp. 18066 TaxID=2681412 RepID=UPI0013584E33|nr:M20/M25/M40 family metallo-hydrolase [Roseomonas sp. 18066]